MHVSHTVNMQLRARGGQRQALECDARDTGAPQWTLPEMEMIMDS